MTSVPSAAPLRWLQVTHETTYLYDAPAELAHHVAFLAPRATPWQAVRQWRLQVDPAPDEWVDLDPMASGAAVAGPAAVPARQCSHDPFGNLRLSFSHARVHDRLRVVSSFEAGLAPPPTLDLAASPAWEDVAASLRYHAGAVHSEAVEFSLPSVYVPHDPALAAFGREAFLPGRSVLAGALALMAQVHAQFTYKPLATSVSTRATDALAGREGVCQDFAHVMIGACRSLGLSARYVSGYLLTQPPPGQPRLVGADASHAWVAVWCPLQGWVALDPTNNVPAGTDHVTLSWGRDYADVAPLRGVIRGGGRAVPQVAVTVMPLEELAAASTSPPPPGAAGPAAKPAAGVAARSAPVADPA
ncbi:transglutaminase family protein [Ideonella livida]|uniref:Transglutaminase family protein n=1 Tax=Ideonella livida TaxID=2707176 RepID=A0A7C9TK66_9BURK|nr:transglutaminase family protein [Ideonella livida]NDY91642.1 transglutaminase family protein [Ideonella livida]